MRSNHQLFLGGAHLSTAKLDVVDENTWKSYIQIFSFIHFADIAYNVCNLTSLLLLISSTNFFVGCESTVKIIRAPQHYKIVVKMILEYLHCSF